MEAREFEGNGEMTGIEIHDMHPLGYLAFDLKEILCCLGSEVTNRVWRCTGLEVTGEAMEEFEAAENTGERIDAETLASLAARTNQVIWGKFFGRHPQDNFDSLIICAIDSSFWEVFGNDACLDKIRACFTDVRPARRLPS